MADPARSLPWSLVAVPAAITLAVTLLRLAGELLHWSPALFNPAAGGGGALVGITWLVPIFGVYFGVRLARAGEAPTRLLRAFGLIVLAAALLPIAGVIAARVLGTKGHGILLVFALASVIAVPLAMRAWPALGRALFAYALAARVPVALLMLIAIAGNWGTHYDVAPPGSPATSAFHKWLWIGLLPQMSVWIAFTVLIGALFGLAAGVIASRGKGRRPAAA